MALCKLLGLRIIAEMEIFAPMSYGIFRVTAHQCNKVLPSKTDVLLLVGSYHSDFPTELLHVSLQIARPSNLWLFKQLVAMDCGKAAGEFRRIIAIHQLDRIISSDFTKAGIMNQICASRSRKMPWKILDSGLDDPIGSICLISSCICIVLPDSLVDAHWIRKV